MKTLLPAALLLCALTACPPTGIVCKPGTEPCGNGCIDPKADRRNCGGCGNQCLDNQDCVAQGESASCTCRAGTTACGALCAVTSSDVHNCGGCGVQCDDGQVCDNGACGAACTDGRARCGTACVEVSSDVTNCGGCGVTCAQGQTCTQGVCDYAAVAACYWSGHLVGFDPGTGVRGPLSDVGNFPGALARFGTTVLSADGNDQRLYQARPSASGEYQQSNRATVTGQVPNAMLVDGDYVYVANAGAGTLQVLKAGEDAGVVPLDEGVTSSLLLGTVAELPLGQNTFPQGAAKVGSTLYVPLYGGYGAEAADAGQALQLVDISTPASPSLVGRLSLHGLDLKPIDGGTPVARPWAITQKDGVVYVALSNLNPATYAPEGPGLLARVLTDGGLDAIDLGAERCLNPQWVTALADGVAVSCGGRVTYGDNSVVESIAAAGVVLVQGEAVVADWSAACDGGCAPFFPGRMAAHGASLLVTDQNGGRVVVLNTGGGTLTESHGGEGALAVCPVSENGIGNVADVSTR